MSVENPQNRDELIEHCLVRLGQPVLKVNVTKQQCEFAIKEAVVKFVEYDYRSTETAWISHEITQQNQDTREFIVPEGVIEVRNVLGVRRNFFSDLNNNDFAYEQIFNPYNHINLSGSGTDKLDVYLFQREISEYENIFSPPEIFDFNPTSRKLKITIENEHLIVGQFVYYQGEISLENTVGNFWANDWLVNYSKSLIQEQWARNLMKFQSIPLPGGGVLNSDAILTEAKSEKERLLDELYENSSLTQAQITFG